MRVFLLTLLLVVGTQARGLPGLGDDLETTLTLLVDAGKELGHGLLDELTLTASAMLNQALKKMTAGPSRRQLDSTIHLTDEDGNIYAHRDELKEALGTALNVSHHMHHSSEQTLADLLHQIDNIVAQHEMSTTNTPATTPAFRKRALDQTAVTVAHLVKGTVAHLKQYLQTALSALSGVTYKLEHPGTFLTQLQPVLSDIDHLIADHNASVDAIVQKLIQEVTSLVPAGSDRFLVDSLTAVFQPHVDVIKSMVASVGQVMKSASRQVFESLITTVPSQDAMESLKAEIDDRFHQTLTSLQPQLTLIAGHLLSALTQQ